MPRRKGPKRNPSEPLLEIKTEIKEETIDEETGPPKLFNIFKSKNPPSATNPKTDIVIDLCDSETSCSPPDLEKAIPAFSVSPKAIRLTRRSNRLFSSSSTISEDHPELEKAIPISLPSPTRHDANRKLSRLFSSDSMISEDDKPVKEVKQKKKKVKSMEKPSNVIKGDPPKVIMKKPEVKSKEPKPSTSKEETRPVEALVPQPDTTNKPKFNIVHADKSKKLAASGPRKRFRTPSPEFKFDIVLRNGSQARRRGPRKKVVKPVLLDATTVTTNEKIDREKDLSCVGCGKSFTKVIPLQEIIVENSTLKSCLKLFTSLNIPGGSNGNKKAIAGIKIKPILHKVQTITTRMAAPTHRIPTIKPKESDLTLKDNLHTNTDEMDMDIEPNPEPVVQQPKVTFSWDLNVSPSVDVKL